MDERLAGMPRIWGRVPTATTRLRQRTRAFWILAALLAAGAVGFLVAMTRIALGVDQPGAVLVSVLSWAIWTLVLFWLVCLVDVYRHVPFSIRAALALWGAGVATVASMVLEGLVAPTVGPVLDALSTGVIEEGTKLLGVVLVAAVVPVLFRRPMGGLICGMMVGLGFCFLENIEYAIAATASGAGADQPYATVASAVLIRGLVLGAALHVVLTGLTGLGVGYFVAHRGASSRRRWTGALVCVLGAMLFHFLWDWFAGIQGVFAGLVMNALNLLHFVLVALMIGYAVRAERRWLTNAAAGTEPVIESDEGRSLRKRRTRRQARRRAGRQARGSVPDASTMQLMKTRQWAQIGYIDALADSAPTVETDRLAGYVRRLRQPRSSGDHARSVDLPSPREPAASDQQQPTEPQN